MNPGITVVITCYNLERYIGAAIDSVLQQKSQTPIEIVVVDDCSSDRSAEVIRSRPVRYFRTAQNGGVLLAMLQGVEAASNDLVCLLDGDDIWEAGKVDAVADSFESDRQLALLTHDLAFIDANGGPLNQCSRPSAVLGVLDKDTQGEGVRAGILEHRDHVWLGSALSFRRSLSKFEEFAAWARALPDPQNTYQDWPLAYWVAALPGAKMGYIPRKLLGYRLHRANHSGDNRTTDRAIRNFTRAKNTLEAMAAIAKLRGLPVQRVKRLERRAEANSYLVQLYKGDRLKSISAFRQVAWTFSEQGVLAKELLRLGGIQLLGPDLFAQLSAARSNMGRTRPKQRQETHVDTELAPAVTPRQETDQRIADD